MFSKLRNKLIFINLSITTAVVLAAFTWIYLYTTKSAENRPPMMNIEFSDEENQIFRVWMENERSATAQKLLVTLICAGIAIEIIVALVSYYLADEAIKPIRNAYEAQKVFIANASHEIKTPLAAISANLEAADIKNNRWISNVQKETDKLTALNTELLTLARTDLVTSMVSEETNLKELVEKSVQSFEPRMSNIKFSKSITVSEKVKINASDFSQIIGILFDNAIKYSDKKISISVNDHSFTITNDGKTINKDSLPHIFDRFYQQDKNSEGVGLGLSIAKSLADKNHWKLTAKSGEKLTIFSLTF